MTNQIDECPICFETLDTQKTDTTIVGLHMCVHKFHRQCIQKWIYTGNNTCPCCRTEFDILSIALIDDDMIPIVCNNPRAHPKGWWIYPFNPELAHEYPNIIENDIAYIETLKKKIERERRINPDDTELFQQITNEILRYQEQHREYRRGLALHVT